MPDYIIKVENLGKKYRIRHQQGGQRYVAMRDVIAEKLTAPFRWLAAQSAKRGMQRAKREEQSVSNSESLPHALSASPLAPSASPLALSPLPPQEDFWALRGVSFEVKQGEVVGIIGRNGAGKSTLLKILSRITEPSEGRVRLRGRVASLLEVGTGFHPELTGRENIYLNGAVLGMTRAEIRKKFDEIVAFAEVEKFLDTPVKRYSSGMYVRLAFAVAAHLEPEILMVDEVLAVGDIEFQKKCIGKMENIAGEGRTVLVVSHSMSTVKALCSRAILLERGMVRAIAPVDAAIAEYLRASQTDAAEKIVRDEDHISGSKWMRVNRIRLLNRVMNNFTVYWQQPISVEMEVDFQEQVSDVSVGVGIKTDDGTWLFVVHHDDDGARLPWTLGPGKHMITFTLQNSLRPGIYRLCVGGHRQVFGGAQHDGVLCEAVNLEVLGYSEQGLTPLPYNTGVINGSCTWEDPERVH